MKPKNFFVIAHNIRSLYNIGSIFRSADAFGVTKIFLTGYSGVPNTALAIKRIAKTALGAENFVAWEYKKSAVTLIKYLKKQYPKLTIIGLEKKLGAQNIKNCKVKNSFALVLGEEVEGVSKNLLKNCDLLLEIPMYGKKESLNVSVAFGIAAYSLTSK